MVIPINNAPATKYPVSSIGRSNSLDQPRIPKYKGMPLKNPGKHRENDSGYYSRAYILRPIVNDMFFCLITWQDLNKACNFLGRIKAVGWKARCRIAHPRVTLFFISNILIITKRLCSKCNVSSSNRSVSRTSRMSHHSPEAPRRFRFQRPNHLSLSVSRRRLVVGCIHLFCPVLDHKKRQYLHNVPRIDTIGGSVAFVETVTLHHHRNQR